ncbi:MAG: PilW family protein [Gammaproteobacteria bacterium]|nr:PilW family protein [Gammaproteobacteria bacterium]
MLHQSRNLAIAKGFTLIELLISVVIGMFLIAGVFTVYINGRVVQDKTEIQTRLIDDARFAVDTIGYDLRHAGYWGESNLHQMIKGATGTSSTSEPKTVGSDPMDPITDAESPDCGVLWYTNLTVSFNASNNSNMFSATCISSGYVPNTDVLVTKLASPHRLPVAALADNVVYVYSNLFSGELFTGKTAPTFLDAAIVGDYQQGYIHRLRTRVYYIDANTEKNDGYPSLHRLDLDVGPKLSNVMLLPGVENLQIQYGIDSTNDGSVNTYVDPAPGLHTNARSVQFWVMLRTKDPELLAGEEQTISMAGKPAEIFTDGFRRVVMSSVVKLRNPQIYSKQAGD